MKIILILFTIFLSPILGFLLSRFLSIGKNNIRKGFFALLFLIILFSFLWLWDLYFDRYEFYYYIILTAYLFYCFLIFSITKQKDFKKKMRSFITGLIPIILIYIIGFVSLPIIGFLSWGQKETFKSQKLKDNYYYTIQNSGNVSTEWLDLDINKKYELIPFMHKEIFHTSINGDQIDKYSITMDFKKSNETYIVSIYDDESFRLDTIIKK